MENYANRNLNVRSLVWEAQILPTWSPAIQHQTEYIIVERYIDPRENG